MRRHYLLRGIYVACGIALCIAIALFVQLAFSYDGKCGGFLPALAGPRPCSFVEYVTGGMAVLGVLLTMAYWPVALVVLLTPPLVGHLLDRRARRRAA